MSTRVVPIWRRISCWLALIVVLLVAAPLPVQARKPNTASLPPVMAGFTTRLEVSRANLPGIVTAAEAAAARTIAHPQLLLNVPYGEQQTFAEEILNRAGGLSNTLPPIERPKVTTPDDIALLAVRAWEVDGPKMVKLMQDYKQQGWMIIVFASKKGRPKDAPIDVLIDNAGGPGKADAALNTIANVLNAWVWQLEYVSALSRLGKYPGILQSMVVPGSAEHNGALQKNGEARRFLGDTDARIPAGELATIYYKRMDLLVAELRSSTTQQQIATAADLVAARLKDGKTVGVASCEHFLLSDIFHDNKTSWKPFNVVWRAKDAFPQHVKEGDLVLFFGYIGLSTVSEDYAAAMRGTKADIIASYIPDFANPANNANEGLVVIEQHWKVGDTEVKLPFAPRSMAPASGIEAALIYRMLDDAAAARMAAQ